MKDWSSYNQRMIDEAEAEWLDPPDVVDIDFEDNPGPLLIDIEFELDGDDDYMGLGTRIDEQPWIKDIDGSGYYDDKEKDVFIISAYGDIRWRTADIKGIAWDVMCDTDELLSLTGMHHVKGTIEVPIHIEDLYEDAYTHEVDILDATIEYDSRHSKFISLEIN